MFDELKEVNSFKEKTGFKNFILESTLMNRLKQSSKRRGVFRTQASIYDGAFL